MKGKKFLSIGLATMFALSFAACGGGENSGNTDGKTINVMLLETGIGTEWIEQIRDEYYNETGVTVNVESDPLLEDYLTQAMGMDGEVDADLYMSGQTYEWTNWAYSGVIEDLSDVFRSEYVDGSTMESNLPTDLKTLGKIGTHRYVAQFTYAPTGIVYNNDLLQELYKAGKISYNTFPTKWDDLVALAKEVAAAKYSYKGNTVQAMVWGDSENDLMDTFKTLWAQMDYSKYRAYFEQEDELNLNLFLNDERTAALEALYDLIAPVDGKSSTSVSGMIAADHDICYTSFLNGTALFCFAGSWFETEMKDYIDADTFEYCFAPVPAVGNNEIVVNINYPTEYFFIPSCSENVETAKDFLKFMFREENLIKMHNSLQTPLASTYDTSKLTLTRWGSEVQSVMSYKQTISGASSLFYQVAGLRPELEGNPFQKMFSGKVEKANLATLLTADFDVKSRSWSDKCRLVELYREAFEAKGIL